MPFGNEELVPMMTGSDRPCSASSCSVLFPPHKPLLIVQGPSLLTLGFV